MQRLKIVTVVGARPQFVKLAPFSKEVRKYFNEVIINTGQHYDYMMSDSFFDDLEIPKPNYNLQIGSGSHGSQTGAMIEKIEEVIYREMPSICVVFGDTNSTMSAALAAVKLEVPVVHIEAGLRSFNMKMPEEINRRVTDHVSTLLCAPTQSAMNNLSNENLQARSKLTGDIMVDAFITALESSKRKSRILEELGIDFLPFSLLTLHRPYNVDDVLTIKKIFKNLANIDEMIVFPIHPRTWKNVEKYNVDVPKNIKVINPVGYLDFITLERSSRRIITDSGGIQKEAYILRKPCITLRSETEWVETVEIGANLLIDPNKEEFYWDILKFEAHGFDSELYGCQVAKKIVESINQLVN